MSDRKSGPIGFKSRFSILSLLPARHPPLDPYPPPLPSLAPRNNAIPPTHSVSSRHPTIISLNDTEISPIESEYPIDIYSPPILPPVPVIPAARGHLGVSSPSSNYGQSPFQSPSLFSGASNTSKRSGESKRSQGHRPPPLDLTRTKAVYPGLKGVIATAGTPPSKSPDPPPKAVAPVGVKPSKQSKQKKAPKVREDDPSEAVELESAHRYPSWRGGRVSIKPGQIIPSGSLGDTSTIRGINPSDLPTRTASRAPTSQSRNIQPSRHDPISLEYDSVLHDVVLTPNYLGLSRSPALPPSPSPRSPTDGHWPLYFSTSRTDRASRRKTLLETIRKGSKMLIEPKGDRSMREIKEKEAREMTKFRQAPRAMRIAEDESTAYSTHSPHLHPGGNLHPRKSPGAREWDVGLGVTWGEVDGKKNKGDDAKMWREKQKKEKEKKRKKMWKLLIVIAVVLIAALIIGLCTSLLRRSDEGDTKTSLTSTPSSETTTSATQPTTPTPSAAPSRTLQTCLDLFSTSASTSPLSYPCSDCVALLSSTTNDYSYSLDNGNSTGVGAALQFCALSDIFKVTASGGLHENGWMKDGSPCGWSGVRCDERGRLTQLQMRYPDVPDNLPESIKNIIGLTTLRLMGNTTVPSGNFPTEILGLPNLTTIDIEYTGLSGQIATMDFAKAQKLSSLVLVNNGQLGNALPSLNNNNELRTLAVTGQGLLNFTEQALPTGLTYLDLSYNAFTGSIPSLSTLQSLQILYLTNNNYTAPPSSIPASVSSLSLTGNTDLTGFMPASICSTSALTSCDLRSTGLRGPNMVPGAMSGIFAPSTITEVTPVAAVGSRTSSTASSASTSMTGGKICGPCQFD